MKKFQVLLVTLLLFAFAFGQKYDYNWLLGYNGGVVGLGPEWSINQLDFSNSIPTLSWSYRPISVVDGGGSASDENGKLQF